MVIRQTLNNSYIKLIMLKQQATVVPTRFWVPARVLSSTMRSRVWRRR
jgi:hypothetical protein